MSIVEVPATLNAPIVIEPATITINAPIVIEPFTINDFVKMDSFRPLTNEWWTQLVRSGYTRVQENDLCDHGFSIDQINIYLRKLEGPNDMIIKAYFSYVYGLERLIESTSSKYFIVNASNVSFYRASAIKEITHFHCDMWEFERTSMDRMYEIFGLAPVIYELFRIMRNIVHFDWNYNISHQYVEKYFLLCRKYKLNFRSCVPNETRWTDRINKFVTKYI